MSFAGGAEDPSRYIENEMYGMIVENMSYEPKSIIRYIQKKCKYISYSKAWSAKQKALEMRFGTFEAAYDNIPRLLAVLCQRNSESYYDLKSLNRGESPPYILQRVFFSLGPCINAFQHCRPLLWIDGTFLTGKYRLQMLIAIGVDGNNQLVPIAFSFVESENTDSWYWFLKRVKVAVVREREDVCLIHDRHPGILRAILDLQEGCVETGELPKWRDVRSRWCIRHIGANFFRQFMNKHLMDMFKRLCKKINQQKFNKQW
jgi:hypothetical protein